MDDELFKLMQIQGDIRIKLMRMGIDENTAGNIAAEVLHTFAISTLIRQEYAEAYRVALAETEEG